MAERSRSWIRLERGRPGDVARAVHPSQRAPLTFQITVKEGDRHAFDDIQLRLLVGVRRQVVRTEQTQQILRARGARLKNW